MTPLLAAAAAAARIEVSPGGPSSLEILVSALIMLVISALMSWVVSAALNRWVDGLHWIARASIAGALPLFTIVAVLVFGQVVLLAMPVADAFGSMFPVPARGRVFLLVILIGGMLAAFASSRKSEMEKRRRAANELRSFE